MCEKSLEKAIENIENNCENFRKDTVSWFKQ